MDYFLIEIIEKYVCACAQACMCSYLKVSISWIYKQIKYIPTHRLLVNTATDRANMAAKKHPLKEVNKHRTKWMKNKFISYNNKWK